MQNKGLKKVCNILLDVLIGVFGLVLLITVYNDIQVKVLKKSYAEFFGYSTFEVQTGSMAPTINASDLIIVKKNNSPAVKDIITYKNGNDFITHRVVEAYKETYVTKGDANNAKDEAITKDQIVGKVVKIIPNFGIIRKTFLNPIVLITLIVTAFIISRLFNDNFKLNIFKKGTKVKKEKKKENVEDYVDLGSTDDLEKTYVDLGTTQDLEKTILVTMIDEEEIKKSDIEMAKEALANMDQQEMDKTIYFRKISVDSTDVNPVVKEVIEDEEVEIKIDDDIEVDEEEKKKVLKKKHKKFDSIIEKVMFLKQEEVSELVTALDPSKLKPNEATIKDEFLKIYIDGKYYNHCGNINVDYNMKNICTKLEEVLTLEADKMIKAYKGNDNKYASKVIKYQTLFTVVMYIEHMGTLYDDIDIKVSAYKKKIIKYLNIEQKELVKILKDIISIQKVYKKIIDEALESVNTATFNLNYNQLTSRKTMYGLVLDHNINFSKIYSDYIISKTYDEGVVAEDKILVMLNMLLSKIAYEMLNNTFKNKYLLYLPISLYSKENKLNHILKLLEDEFVKNSVYIVVKASALIENKKVFKDIKKMGYQIAVILDIETIKEKDRTIFGIADYIFIDKKASKNFDLSLLSPDTIVFENIISKLDIPGGE